MHNSREALMKEVAKLKERNAELLESEKTANDYYLRCAKRRQIDEKRIEALQTLLDRQLSIALPFNNLKKYQHQNGSDYVLITDARMECEPDKKVIVYMAIKGEQVWVRPGEEFFGMKDGKPRFKSIL